MRNKLLIILIFFIFSACEKIIKKEINSYDLITENSKVVISTEDLENVEQSVWSLLFHEVEQTEKN